MQHYKRILSQWLLPEKRKSSLGFTLMELLIAIVISSIVTSGLLYLVMELMQLDRREASIDQVEQDMSRAIDYIEKDLQDAIYVYTKPQRFTTLLQDDKNFPDKVEDTPVLAFWRIDPIKSNKDPTSNEDELPTICDPRHDDYDETDSRFEQCQSLRVRQATSTLVIYGQRINNDDSSNWSGQSRLTRYELTQYEDTEDLIIRPGRRDPENLSSREDFENWTPDEDPVGLYWTLVDFVDSPTTALDRSASLNRLDLSDSESLCSNYGPEYQVVPNAATSTTNTSFFACVRNPSASTNQDVIVFLRGSTYSGSSMSANVAGRGSTLPTLEARVRIKGIIDKRIERSL